MNEYKNFRVPVLPAAYCRQIWNLFRNTEETFQSLVTGVSPARLSGWTNIEIYLTEKNAAAMLMMTETEFDEWMNLRRFPAEIQDFGSDGHENQILMINIWPLLNFMSASQK